MVRGKEIGKETGIYLYLALYLEGLEKFASRVEHAIVIGSYGWGTVSYNDDFDLAVVTALAIPLNVKRSLMEWWAKKDLPSPSFVFSTPDEIQSKIGPGNDYFSRLLAIKKFEYFSEVVGPNRQLIQELEQVRRVLTSEQAADKLSPAILAEARKIVQPIEISSSPVKSFRPVWMRDVVGVETLATHFDLLVSLPNNNLLVDDLARVTALKSEQFAFERFDDGEGRLIVPDPATVKDKNVLVVHSIRNNGDEDLVQLLGMMAGLRDFRRPEHSDPASGLHDETFIGYPSCPAAVRAGLADRTCEF